MSGIGSDELLLLEAAIVRIEAAVIRQRNKPASKAHSLTHCGHLLRSW